MSADSTPAMSDEDAVVFMLHCLQGAAERLKAGDRETAYHLTVLVYLGLGVKRLPVSRIRNFDRDATEATMAVIKAIAEGKIEGET